MRKQSKIILVSSTSIVLLAVAFYGIVVRPLTLADQILLEGGYPPLPQGAKIKHVSWNHRWIDTGGLLPIVELIFLVDPPISKSWISSIDPQREQKTIRILERNEKFGETNGLIQVKLMISYK